MRIIYEAFIVLLVVTYGICIISGFGEHPVLTHSELNKIDIAFIIFFSLEYAIRLWKANDKKQFVKQNWLDLVALLPIVSEFRFARLFRLVRLVRLMKASPFLWKVFTSKELRGIFLFASIIIFWSAAAVMIVERGNNSAIKSYWDALWWTMVTTTTVGYGDIAPHTAGGRIIAIFLMVMGLSVFGLITANLTSQWKSFIQSSEEKKFENKVRSSFRGQAKHWVDRIEELSDEEYRSLLEVLEALRDTRLEVVLPDAAEEKEQQPRPNKAGKITGA